LIGAVANNKSIPVAVKINTSCFLSECEYGKGEKKKNSHIED
jgi:hypothetical protein